MKRNKLPTKVQEQQLRKPNSQVEVTEQGKNLFLLSRTSCNHSHIESSTQYRKTHWTMVKSLVWQTEDKTAPGSEEAR